MATIYVDKVPVAKRLRNQRDYYAVVNSVSVVGSRISGATPMEHNLLLNKQWLYCAHNGTENTIAGFDESGNTYEIPFWQTDDGRYHMSGADGYLYLSGDTIYFQAGGGSGTGGTSDHTLLNNLNWTDSNHYGSAFTVPAFNGSGEAYEIPMRYIGTDNIGIGIDTLKSNTTGYSNIGLGWSSLENSNGDFNVAIGYSALVSSSTADRNIAIGNSALNDITTGGQNIGIGRNAGNYLINGVNNIYLGDLAYASSTGATNEIVIGSSITGKGSDSINIGDKINLTQNYVALGTQALMSSNLTVFGVGIGYRAAESNTTGNGNVAIGYGSNFHNTDGDYNIAIGWEALPNMNGNNNIGIGYQSGFGSVSGSTSIYIGNETHSDNATAANEIVIGSFVTGNGSNTITLGNSGITDTYFEGKIHINTGSTGYLYLTNSAVTYQDETISRFDTSNNQTAPYYYSTSALNTISPDDGLLSITLNTGSDYIIRAGYYDRFGRFLYTPLGASSVAVGDIIYIYTDHYDFYSGTGGKFIKYKVKLVGGASGHHVYYCTQIASTITFSQNDKVWLRVISTNYAAGTSGTSGTSGINGTSGGAGTSGTSGINGTSGTSGVDATATALVETQNFEFADLPVATGKTYYLEIAANYNFQINTLKLNGDTGTTTIDVYINSTKVTGLSGITATTTTQTHTATANNNVVVDDVVKFIVTGLTASPTTIRGSMKTTRN